jgi:tetratricopeptide (TPR) repeat protein
LEEQKVLNGWLQSRTPSQMIVLQGMGGSGKTQLALQCCQIARESGFVATFWINASSPVTVAQSYQSMSRIISPGIDVGNDEGETISLVQIQMKKWAGRWLLVFDNYNNPNSFQQRPIRDYIPGQGGHVIFTSRHKDSSRLGLTMDLSRMTEDEGIRLLLHFIPGSKNSEAGEVIALLGYLALAIDQAGAYIHSRLLPLSQFVSHYKKRKMRVLEEIPDEWEYHDLQDPDHMRRLSVFTTWDMSLDLIKGNEEEKSQKLQFLTLASFMDPYQISEVYFRSYSAGNDITWMEFLKTGGQWDTEKLADVLVEFSRLSLIQSFDRRENDSSFSIHPLICDCIKFRKTTDAMSTVTELTNMLATFLRTHDISYLPLGSNQETTRHINAWSEVNDNILQSSSESMLAMNHEAVELFAMVYKSQGQYDKAERLYNRALEGWEEKLGPRHPDTLNTVNSLAIVYRNQGRYDEAERLYGRALEGYKEKLGPTHPYTLYTVNGLALVYRNQGRYDEAEQLYGRALEGYKEKLGPTHPNTLYTVNGLALVYWNQGRYNEAEQLYGRALEGYKKKLGPTHPDTLNTVQNLAIVYRDQGRYNEAEQLYGRVLEGYKKKLGPTHPDTLNTIQNLAIVYWNQGRYNEAEQLYGRVLEGQEKKLGPVHPDTLNTVQNLALVHWDQGRYNEAEQLYNRALEGQEKKLGPVHPDTLNTVQNLALVYRDQGRYNEAEQLYNRALEGQEKKLGLIHPDTLEIVDGLANLYRKQSQYNKAERLFNRALEGRKEKLGPIHPDTLETVNGLAHLYQKQGRNDEAERLFNWALEGRGEKLGPTHPHTLETADGLANLYREQGRHEEGNLLGIS